MPACNTISFNRGVPAPETLPSEKVAESCRSILREDGKTILQYYSAQGYAPLREHLSEQVGPATTKDQILVGNGSLQLLNILANVVLEPGDTVLVESPTYDRAITVFSRLGAQIRGIPLQNDGIALDAFKELVQEEQPKLFYIIPDFQNPTGITTSEEKRRKIVQIAEDHNFQVVENTLYRRLRYSGEDTPTFWELNPNVVFRLSSFSKILSPGLRVGWLVARPSLMDTLSQYAEDTYITSNMLSQGIIYKILEQGWLETHVNSLKDLYHSRLKATLQALEEFLPQADWVKPKGGFFVGIWMPNVDVRKIYDESHDAGLALSESSSFFPDRKPRGFLRIPFCALEEKKIEQGIKRLANLYHELKG